MNKLSHNMIKWGLFVALALFMAITITTCHAQTKMDTAKIGDWMTTIDAVGQIFYYNQHDYIIKYNEGNWGSMPDSLTALNAVFNKYSETLSTNRGLRTKNQAAILAASILYSIMTNPKDTDSITSKKLDDFHAVMEEYKRLNKLYP